MLRRLSDLESAVISLTQRVKDLEAARSRPNPSFGAFDATVFDWGNPPLGDGYFLVNPTAEMFLDSTRARLGKIPPTALVCLYYASGTQLNTTDEVIAELVKRAKRVILVIFRTTNDLVTVPHAFARHIWHTAQLRTTSANTAVANDGANTRVWGALKAAIESAR